MANREFDPNREMQRNETGVERDQRYDDNLVSDPTSFPEDGEQEQPQNPQDAPEQPEVVRGNPGQSQYGRDGEDRNRNAA